MHARALAYKEVIELVDGAGKRIEAIKQQMDQIAKPIRI